MESSHHSLSRPDCNNTADVPSLTLRTVRVGQGGADLDPSELPACEGCQERQLLPRMLAVKRYYCSVEGHSDYRRCPFLNSAHCSVSNPISSRSVRCWRTMIQGWFFTRFAKFQGIVSVSDFWFPRRLHELHEALLGLLGSFCFTWLWLYPLCCQVLYHYSVSMIVSRFTSFT